MNRRLLLMAVLLLAGLAAYAWFALREDARERERTWQQGERVLSLARERIESLEVTGPDGRQLRFRRGAGGWEEIGGGDPARAEEVAEVLYGWSLVRFLTLVDEAPGDLGKYGLAAPRYRLSVVAVDGESHSLSIGDDSTLASALGSYALLDDRPEVVLLEAGVWDLLAALDRMLGLTTAQEEGQEPPPAR